MGMSASAIQGIQVGIYELLTASGPYHAGQVSSCSFDVLESTSTCAITYFLGRGSEFAPQSYDRGGQVANYAAQIMVEGTLWIKDTGQAEAVLGRTWKAPDDIIQTFAKDTTLGGRVSNCFIVAVDADVSQWTEAGQQLWMGIGWRARVDIL